MKRLSLAFSILAIMFLLASLDYWFNFRGKTLLPQEEKTQVQASPPQTVSNTTQEQPPSNTTDSSMTDFSGVFPSLLATNNLQFPYSINTQQRVFDLFGIFDLNALPGLQILRYDIVPVNPDLAYSPLQVYELKNTGQNSGITFLRLKTGMEGQLKEGDQLNELEEDYANKVLFYNPIAGSENAFLLAENGMVLGFNYPKTSTATFEAIKAFLKQIPINLPSNL